MRLSVGRWWTFVKPFSIGQARVDENLESDETLAILDNDIDSLEQHPGDCAPEGRLAKLSSPVTATAYGARSGVYCWRATSHRRGTDDDHELRERWEREPEQLPAEQDVGNPEQPQFPVTASAFVLRLLLASNRHHQFLLRPNVSGHIEYHLSPSRITAPHLP